MENLLWSYCSPPPPPPRLLAPSISSTRSAVGEPPLCRASGTGSVIQKRAVSQSTFPACEFVDRRSLKGNSNLYVADCIHPASPLGGAVGLESVGCHSILKLVEVDEDEGACRGERTKATAG